MKQQIKRIPIDLIQEDPRLQVRSERSIEVNKREYIKQQLEDSIKDFKLVLEAGGELTPLEVFKDGDVYLVKDGQHRLQAYREHHGYDPLSALEKPDTEAHTIPVVVLEGDLKFHLASSHTVNTQHGVGLTKKESTQIALHALVHQDPDKWPPVKVEVARWKLSESQIEKIRRAARTLIAECEIAPTSTPDEIESAVSQWVANEKKKHTNVEGDPKIPTDERSFRSVRYVNNRKVLPEIDPEELKINQIIKKLDGHAEHDSFALREAIYELNRKYGLKVRVLDRNKERKAMRDLNDNDEF